MRAAIFFMTLTVVAWVGFSSPINDKYKHLRSPSVEYHFRRSPDVYDVKGHHVKVAQAVPAISQLEMNLTKGDYVCGDKICKLQPGEVPKGCNGVCQYRV